MSTPTSSREAEVFSGRPGPVHSALSREAVGSFVHGPSLLSCVMKNLGVFRLWLTDFESIVTS